MKDKIGIVIVNYNGEKYQNDALKTIYESSYDNFEVVIVDSGSKDNSIAMAKELYPHVHYLLQEENVGVAKGNNIGIHYAIEELKTDYVLLLNNDIELHKDTIRYLMETANPDTIVVPKIYYYDPKDMLWFAGGAMVWKKGESEHWGNFETDCGQYDVQKTITYSPTCCMLIHKSVFERVGFIDETVFMYFDDTDFCARVNKAGITILYVPKAVLWHKVSSAGGGSDSKVQVYYMTRNKLYYMNKHKSDLKFPARIFTYSKFLIKYVISPFYKKNDRYIMKAWKDYRNGKMGRCDNL